MADLGWEGLLFGAAVFFHWLYRNLALSAGAGGCHLLQVLPSSWDCCDPPPAVFHQYAMPSCFLSLAPSQGDGVCGSKWSGGTVLPPAFIASMSVSPVEKTGAGMEQGKQPNSGLCRCCHGAVEQEPMKMAVGPCFMVGKCLPSPVENLCFLTGLVTTIKSGTTVAFSWCHRCGALIPECSLCQLLFTVPWMTPALLPYPVDWAFNLLCLNFLVGMSWNCTESRSLWNLVSSCFSGCCTSPSGPARPEFHQALNLSRFYMHSISFERTVRFYFEIDWSKIKWV